MPRQVKKPQISRSTFGGTHAAPLQYPHQKNTRKCTKHKNKVRFDISFYLLWKVYASLQVIKENQPNSSTNPLKISPTAIEMRVRHTIPAALIANAFINPFRFLAASYNLFSLANKYPTLHIALCSPLPQTFPITIVCSKPPPASSAAPAAGWICPSYPCWAGAWGRPQRRFWPARRNIFR